MVYENNWESLNSRKVPEWFGKAKFGIFIHWGLYSIPGYAPKKDYVVNGENEGGVHIDTGGDPTMDARPVIHMGEFEYNTNGGYDSANGIGILVEGDIESSGLIVEDGYVNLTGESESCSSSTGGGRVELFSETVKLTTWNDPCEGDTFVNTLGFNKDGLNVEIDDLEGDFKNFSVNKDGLTFDGSRVVTEQILGEHDELVKVDENGNAEATAIYVGDYLIVTKDGVYRVGRDEFAETYQLA